MFLTLQQQIEANATSQNPPRYLEQHHGNDLHENGTQTKENLVNVTKLNPCLHCGKPDWCYTLDKYTVCNRDASPAPGWIASNKTDKNGKRFYEPVLTQKAPRTQGKKEYIYHDRNGQPLIKVTRIDDGNGKKRIFQSHWNGINWVKGLTDQIKNNVTIYQYAKVKAAIEQGKTIFLVEGEGIADLLWEMGIPATTTIGGAGKYRAYGNYKPDLENAILVLCPDRDEPGLKHMEDIFQDFPEARWLYAPPNEFFWTHLPKSGGLDLQDWIKDGATVDDILQAIENRRVVVDSLNNILKIDAQRERPTTSKHEKQFNMIRAVWGERLRWNILKKYVELDGKRLPLDHIDLTVALDVHIDISKERARGIVLQLAKENAYSPVVDYLQQVSEKHKNVDLTILDTMAERYFGTNDPLHAALMKRTMIAAVARAYQPGCKHDNITILQGKQKSLKSTFWEVLAGEDFFTDDISGTEKDEIMKISQYWLLEYAEFENAYKKKDVSQLKAFLSRRRDSMRPPYGKDIEDFPRPSIMVGSTNQNEFLYDPTGERRYWVILVKVNRINIAQLKLERDLLWAAAVAAYKNGEQWHLTQAEDAALEIANKQFSSTDPWEPVIMAWANLRQETNIPEILTDVLKIDLAKQSRSEQHRVASILRANGWVRGDRKRIAGKLVYPWLKIETENGTGYGTVIEPRREQPEVITQSGLESSCSISSINSSQTFQNSAGVSEVQNHPAPLTESLFDNGTQWNGTELETEETTTPQALEDCSIELNNELSPTVGDGTVSDTVSGDSLKVGDPVTHVDQFHYRGEQAGVVESVTDAGVLVKWLEDGENQRHEAHRTYNASELKRNEHSLKPGQQQE
jgi:predicted P-loop ATPase